MNSAASIAIRFSLLVHLGTGLLAVGLSAIGEYESPSSFSRRGQITLQASFAASEPAAAADMVSPFGPNEHIHRATSKLTAASVSLPKVPPVERLSRIDLPAIPAELEECQCEPPTGELPSPRSQEELQPAGPKRFIANTPARKLAEPIAIPAVASTAISAQPDEGIDEQASKFPSNPLPPYPAEAYAAGQQGRVILEVHLSAGGTVDSLRVATSSGFASLDAAALATVKDWRFEPAKRRGRPIATVVRVPIRFTIQP